MKMGVPRQAYELEEFWRREPDPKTDVGDLKAPLTVAPVDREHAWQILQSAGRLPAGSARGGQSYACGLRSLLWPGRAQKDGGGLCNYASGAGDPYL